MIADYADRIQTVVWDWNGTLLDDVDICVTSINILLQKRKLPLLDKNRYRELFNFPVSAYYEQIGFDFSKEDYESIADEFMEVYFNHLPVATLTKDVIDMLQLFTSAGQHQLIISAMRQEDLDASVFRYGIRSYFSGIYGARDHFANGKIGHARSVFGELSIDPRNALLLGDTCHDAELASALGCHCILFSGGHFSKGRLAPCGYPVATSMNEILQIFYGN